MDEAWQASIMSQELALKHYLLLIEIDGCLLSLQDMTA